jgi:putative transcriptional regulator
MMLSVDKKTDISDDAITEYATGNLSPAKHAIVACQSEICEEVSSRVAFQEQIAAFMIEQVNTPGTLSHLLGCGLDKIKWKSLIPGVAVHDVLGDRNNKAGDRLYLLKAKGGMQMPNHGHNGEEWTLILKGSYNIGDKVFARGDLHIEDEDEIHSPHINEGEDCICLVMTQGPLKMQSFIPRLLQPLIGI